MKTKQRKNRSVPLIYFVDKCSISISRNSAHKTYVITPRFSPNSGFNSRKHDYSASLSPTLDGHHLFWHVENVIFSWPNSHVWFFHAPLAVDFLISRLLHLVNLGGRATKIFWQELQPTGGTRTILSVDTNVFVIVNRPAKLTVKILLKQFHFQL